MNLKILSVLSVTLMFVGCKNPVTPSAGDVVDENITTAATNFEINRRVVFYNIRNGSYILSIEGRCVKSAYPNEISITCKTGPDGYKRHAMGLNGDVTYIMEQLEPLPANSYRYRVIFRPATLIPDIEID